MNPDDRLKEILRDALADRDLPLADVVEIPTSDVPRRRIYTSTLGDEFIRWTADHYRIVGNVSTNITAITLQTVSNKESEGGIVPHRIRTEDDPSFDFAHPRGIYRFLIDTRWKTDWIKD